MNAEIKKILDAVSQNGDLDAEAVAEAKARQEVLAKPTGALGDLETISIKLAGITGTLTETT